MTGFEELDIDDVQEGAETLTVQTKSGDDWGTVVDPESLGWESVRKRPVMVHAVQLDRRFGVETWEGAMGGRPGDYLVCGVEGELYPVDQDVFEQTYWRGDEGAVDVDDVQDAVGRVFDHADEEIDEAVRSSFTKRGAELVLKELGIAPDDGDD